MNERMNARVMQIGRGLGMGKGDRTREDRRTRGDRTVRSVRRRPGGCLPQALTLREGPQRQFGLNTEDQVRGAHGWDRVWEHGRT